MEFALKSDIGKKRQKNEDSVFADGRLFIVADGMGGHNAGEIASSMAVKTVSERLKDCKGEYRAEITGAIHQANKEVFQAAVGEYDGMGTTIDVCMYDDGHIFVGHVGDSRVYIINGDKIKKLTVDHSYVEMLVERGELTREEAENYPMKNMITRAVGTSETVQVDYYEKELEKGDTVLMCSDGLTNMVSEKRIAEIIKAEKKLNVATEKLTDEANKSGGSDNITVIAFNCFTKGE